MSEGIATLGSAPGESIRAEQIAGAVTSAGFTPREMSAVAVGRLSKRGDGAALEWEGSENAIRLVQGAFAVDWEEAIARGEPVRVRGALVVSRDQGSESFTISIAVDSLEPLKDAVDPHVQVWRHSVSRIGG